MADLLGGAQDWDGFVATLPELLSRLLGSPVYGNGTAPPSNERGVYLFSEGGAHLYTGRTSVTARSRAAGNLTGRSFTGRYAEHTNSGSPPGSAPFAARLAYEHAAEEGILSPPAASEWWLPIKRRHEAADEIVRQLNDLFEQAKAEIAGMECRVLPLEDDEKGVRSLLVEMYVHVQLSTPYNDFSTS